MFSSGVTKFYVMMMMKRYQKQPLQINASSDESQPRFKIDLANVSNNMTVSMKNMKLIINISIPYVGEFCKCTLFRTFLFL